MTPTIPKEEVLPRALQLAHNYLQECYDNLPLKTHEHSLALAYAGLRPSDAPPHIDPDHPKGRAAWVLSVCWFLKMMHPTPLRESGKPLYALLEQLEMDAPGDWANTHNEVVEVIRNHGYEVDDLRNL